MADLRVAIVDGHPALRNGVKSAIDRQAGLAFVASGSEANHVSEVMKRHKVDVLLLDVRVAGDVFQEIASASAAYPELTIVIFTDSADTNDAVQAIMAGADGYVLKSSPADELFHAIEMARGGRVFITEPLDKNVFAALKREDIISGTERGVYHNQNSKPLNCREIQIIQFLYLGKKNREIASALSLSERTIKFYVSQLMTKLHVRSRLEIIVFMERLYPELCCEQGLVMDALR